MSDKIPSSTPLIQRVANQRDHLVDLVSAYAAHRKRDGSSGPRVAKARADMVAYADDIKKGRA